MQACAGARTLCFPVHESSSNVLSGHAYSAVRSQLGDTNVGKSSLVLRFVKNQFNADQVTTVGAAFLQSPVPLDDSEDKILFGIWDTAGSERYKALAPMVRCGVHMCPTFPLVALAVNLLCHLIVCVRCITAARRQP